VPLVWWPYAVSFLALIALLAFLMVSTWRYRSFKDFSMVSPRSPRSVVLLGAFIYLIWNYSQPVLLAMSITYVGSGVFIRVGGVLKRRFRRPAAA
jgi:CDP-diacylglycerol--serine O-phosphatidyltransferase